MSIYLGDVSVEQIEHRTGITLSDEDREYLKAHRQHKINNTKIERGCWHCFDIPFSFNAGDEETAGFYLDMFKKYDWSQCKEPLQIVWG